jgi:type IV secretion system protein VirD4
MNRRPTLCDGVWMPKTAGVGAVALVLGWAGRGHAGAGWVIGVGVLLLATAGLVLWRVIYGGWVAAGLWTLGLAWALRALPPGGAGLAGLRAYWSLAAVGGLVLLGSVGMVGQRSRSGSRGLVRRWSDRSRRNDGVASRWAILRTASRLAVRRKATVLRPSLGELRWWHRLRVRTHELATPVARVGWLRIWSPIEDVTLRLGGPRTGKSGELAGRILDGPGAVIATSTRTDLVELTGPLRGELGPVFVFNPSGVGGLDSTITFDPLSGCAEPKTATDRASDMLAAVSAPGAGGGDREFWASQARRVLAALLHAAALGAQVGAGTSMRDVLRWLAEPSLAATEIQRLLPRSPEPNYETDALQFLNTNDRTRSSIAATVMPALGWLTDPTAARAAVDDGQGGSGGFDVGRLLGERGTVYMLGAEDAQTAPLVTALTGHIAREARRIAAEQPAGRLDPPLTLALDEAALICPVPLDLWTADMGGRNITIHIAAQSRAQLRQKFGDPGAAAIINNTACLLIYGGTRDPDDLAAYATLAGEREEEVATWDHLNKQSSITTRRVPVLTAAQIAQLPAGRVLIVRRGMPVALGRVQMAWRRRDVRTHQRRLRAVERYERWAARWEALLAWAEPRLALAGAWLDGRIAGANAWLDTDPDPLARLNAWLRAWWATRSVRAAVKAAEARAAKAARADRVADRASDDAAADSGPGEGDRS